MSKINQEHTNLQKGCGKEYIYHGKEVWQCGVSLDIDEWYDLPMLCSECQAKLSQHDKTMKLVMEEIDKVLFDINLRVLKDELITQETYILKMVEEELKKSLGGQNGNN